VTDALRWFYGLPFRKRAASHLTIASFLLVYAIGNAILGTPELLTSIELVMFAAALFVGVPLLRHPVPEQAVACDEAAAPEADVSPEPAEVVLPSVSTIYIYVDAPLAKPLHRSLAGLIDFGLASCGVLVFMLLAVAFGGTKLLRLGNALIFLAALMANILTTGFQLAFSGTDSLGMKVAGLQWVTFDGEQPSARQRWVHFVGNVVSTLSMVGLLWALVDEEGLTWADHIARMFPTLRQYAERAETLRTPHSPPTNASPKLIKTDVALWSAKAGRLGIKGARRLKVG